MGSQSRTRLSDWTDWLHSAWLAVGIAVFLLAAFSRSSSWLRGLPLFTDHFLPLDSPVRGHSWVLPHAVVNGAVWVSPRTLFKRCTCPITLWLKAFTFSGPFSTVLHSSCYIPLHHKLVPFFSTASPPFILSCFFLYWLFDDGFSYGTSLFLFKWNYPVYGFMILSMFHGRFKLLRKLAFTSCN